MLAVFEEARPLVLVEKLDYGRRIGRVVRRPPFESLKGGLDARLPEEERRIFAVFIEIGIEDTLVHHVALTLDGEDHPSQIMRFEYGEGGGIVCDCFLYDLGMVVYVLFPSRDDLCDDAEAVASWSLGKDRTVSALLNLVLEKSPLGNRHRLWFRPIVDFFVGCRGRFNYRCSHVVLLVQLMRSPSARGFLFFLVARRSELTRFSPTSLQS